MLTSLRRHLTGIKKWKLNRLLMSNTQVTVTLNFEKFVWRPIPSFELLEVASEVASEAPEGGNLVIYDLRPLSEYERCHIHGARHFDPLQLKKSANQFPREAYYYKGGAESEKMIVLYDGDGKVCACTRNFDRIWRTLPPSQCSPFGTLC